MAIRYSGRCGVAGCAWQFSSPSAALLADLYGNHVDKAHTGPATLLIEPGSIVIPWPPDSEELIRLKLAESPEQSRARAGRRLRFASIGSAGTATCMVLVALFMTTQAAFAPGIAVLGGPIFWVAIFAADLLFAAGAVVCSVRVSRSSVSVSVQRFGFAFLVAGSVVGGLVAGFLWLGLIAIADIGTSGGIPESFSYLYVLQLVLAPAYLAVLILSTQAFSNAKTTNSERSSPVQQRRS